MRYRLLSITSKENDNPTPEKVETSCNEFKSCSIPVIKQELNTGDNEDDKETSDNSTDNDGQPPSKRPKLEFADAESNTLQTGKPYLFKHLNTYIHMQYICKNLF